MTHDEILHLAEQVGCGWARNGTEPVLIHAEKIVAFATLVASAEREACARACEDLRGTISMFATSKDCRTHNNAITGCVKAISARGES